MIRAALFQQKGARRMGFYDVLIGDFGIDDSFVGFQYVCSSLSV